MRQKERVVCLLVVLVSGAVLIGCGKGKASVDADAVAAGTDGGGPGTAAPYEPAVVYSESVTDDEHTVVGPADREIPLRIRWAEDAPGPLPVVIWSHAGSYREWDEGRSSHGAWSKRLAAAGYAVIHPSHIAPTEDQLKQLCKDFGLTDPAACNDTSLGEGGKDEFKPGDYIPFASVGICRPGDIAAILEAVAAGDFDSSVALDPTRIAVVGWSGGSTTPMQLAGGSRIIAVGEAPYQLPPREDVGAYVALSAQGAGFSNWYDEDIRPDENSDLTGTSWDEVVGPFLSLTAAFDQANGMTGADRQKPYDNMPAGNKRLLYSADERAPLNHNTFNLEHADHEEAFVQGINDAITSSVIAFLDWHLLERPAAQAWLDSDAALLLLGEKGGRWETK